MAEAERAEVPLLQTAVGTATAIGKLTALLEDRLAVREVIHGVLLDILGLGVLMIGESGIGKSECALDLVVRGHRLVADDTVEIRRRAASIIVGSCPELTRHHMEVRGIGVINLRDLFGVASTRTSKRVELVVQLERWEQHHDYDRLGIDDAFFDLLGLRVPLIRMPVAPGRNLAILVEVAARNQLLRTRGDQRRARAGGAARRPPARGAAPGGSAGRRGGRGHRAGRTVVSPARRRSAGASRAAPTTRTPRAPRRPPSGPPANFLVLTGCPGPGSRTRSARSRTSATTAWTTCRRRSSRCSPTCRCARTPTIRRSRSWWTCASAASCASFHRIWRRLVAAPGLHPMLIFLEASHAVLLRRFSETRRPHPLAPGRPIADVITDERDMLKPIRAMADEIVDTSDLTVHELRQLFHGMVRARGQGAPLMLTFESFGFKHGVPLDADLVFDCRFLPNPHFVAGLRSKTGRDKSVATYMRRYPATREFSKRLAGFLRYVVPNYVSEGKSYLTVAIGCTGGRHRSVYLAELLKKELAPLKGVSTRTRHRDLARDAA